MFLSRHDKETAQGKTKEEKGREAAQRGMPMGVPMDVHNAEGGAE